MIPAKAIDEIDPPSIEVFESEICAAIKPVVIRGLVKDWPVVKIATQDGAKAVFDYLSGFDNGHPQNTLIGAPELLGRFTYSDDLRSQNFTTQPQSFTQVFEDLITHANDGKARFIQSAFAHEHIPEFLIHHKMSLINNDIKPRLWIGNETTAQTHYDLSENIACVVLGQRRFTLFPPEQLKNLYPGPLETAPGRIPVSLTSLDTPDFDQHPGFKEALNHRISALLYPGDAIYIPPGWWHHVRAEAQLNMLVNYWWSRQAAQVKHPYAALMHSMLAFKSLSEAERNVWRNMFDYFVFEKNGEAMGHLDPSKRGMFGGVPPEFKARTIYDILTALAGEVGLPPPPKPPKH